MQTIYIQIGSKGQLVIPAELREEVKLSIGTKVRDQGVGGSNPLSPTIKSQKNH